MQTERDAFLDAIGRAQSGDAEAENALLRDNLPLVCAIAKRYLNTGPEYDDLVQLGSIGLLKAIRKFDPSFCVCFSTYAVPLIAGEIRRFLRDDGIVKYARSTKSLAARVRKELSDDPELTIDALAKRLCVSREDLAAALSCDSPVCSLDEPMPDGSGNLFDKLGTESEEERSVSRLTLNDAMDTLSAREKEIVDLRYRKEKTQSETGRILGISQVQVSRLEKKILSELRSRMSD
ncbi:MAG: sigma-70 family RNA polymerase sigma factor [Clostridia bacterium]|nr:sigma-70 family RNA polymerase sigma factor [Clostridia bacterium]